MRLIDADALRKMLVDRQITIQFFNMRERDEIGCIIEMLDDAPTINAVPAVRCRECKHYRPGKHFTDINFCQRLPLYAEKGGLNVSDDDFCSHGEYGYGEGMEVDGDGS